MTIMNTQRIERSIGGAAGMICTGFLVVVLTASVSAAGGPPQEPARDGRLGRAGGPLGMGVMNLPTLTDAQRDQIRGVMEQHRDELRRLTEQVATARRALEASAFQGQVDEHRANELGASVNALALAQARMHSDIVALLTPDQRQQIETRREQMREWMESRPEGQRRGPGRPGGPGGRGRR